MLRPSTTRFRWYALLALFPALGGTTWGQSTPSSPVTTTYKDPTVTDPAFADLLMDNIEGSWINLGHVPIRPIVRKPGTDEIFVVNTHNSTVERFLGGTSQDTPEDIFPTPWNPVSIAYWERPGGDELVVACRGSYVIVRMSAADGTVLQVIETRLSFDDPVLAEPGDLLLDEINDRLFVSCSGSDAVIQFDISQDPITIHRVYSLNNDPDFLIKHPLFMAFDRLRRVLVAPLNSGNGTRADGSFIDANEAVVPFSVQGMEGGQPVTYTLPDEDLFLIDPTPGSENVSVFATSTGTTLFALGRNPATGEIWQLNTDADNADPARQTEPHLSGDFIDNRITITPWNGNAPYEHIPLEFRPPNQWGGIRVAQPYGLTFSTTGTAYITGLLSDNVVAVPAQVSPTSGDGTLTGAWDLPDGSIPRGIVLSNNETEAFVYCWGTNTVEKINVQSSESPPVETFYLRYDPTPNSVAEGREMFYDADNSRLGDVSCASCHIEGRSDALAWNLSAGPEDNKGPMATQTLAGLERLPPFHWRGERSLRDFKPAIRELLGGIEPTDEDFEKFEDFVFSIRNPANPEQPKGREIEDSAALQGLDDFFTFNNLRGKFKCVDCHMLPTGTMNDIFPDTDVFEPRRGHRKVAPFHELWRKEMPAAPDIDDVSFLGTGLTHAGLVQDLGVFVRAVFENLPNPPAEIDQAAEDITSLLRQLDQGIAPASHRAFLLNPTTAANSVLTTEIENYLVAQAADRHCSIAVYGVSHVGGSLESMRWSYDLATQLFIAEDVNVSPRSFNDFVVQALATQDADEWNVFVGLPMGMADRFAIDYDMDGKRNQNDFFPRRPSGFVNDQDPPGFVTPPTLQWESGKVARISWITDEPTRYEVICYPDGVVQSSDEYATGRSIIVSGLRPTSPVFADNPGLPPAQGQPLPSVHVPVITVFDRNGNPSQQEVLAVQTKPFLRDLDRPAEPNWVDEESEQLIITTSMEHDPAPVTANGRIDFRVKVGVDYKFDTQDSNAHPEGRIVVAGLTVRTRRNPVNGENGAVKNSEKFDNYQPEMGSSKVNSLKVQGEITGGGTGMQAFTGSSGPTFLLAPPTNAQGETHLSFSISETELDPGGALSSSKKDLVLFIECVIPLESGVVGTYVLDPMDLDPVLPTKTAKKAYQRWSFPDSIQSEMVVLTPSP